MANSTKIVLAGFSGSGKTTLLKQLQKSAPAGWSTFDDLDRLVAPEGVPLLVEKHGWEHFRALEQTKLGAWLQQEGQGVLSLGGGTLTPEALHSLALESNVLVVYLHADFETCWKRISESDRPLVRQGKDHLKKLYLERMLTFEKVEFRLENSDQSDPKDLATEIWRRIVLPYTL